MSGRLRTGTSGFAYPGLVAALLPAGAARRRRSSATTARARDGRAQQHVLPPAEPGRGRRLARRDAGRLPVRGQGPARRLVPGAPGRSRSRASPWLTEPLRRFGDRLGTVLFRVPDGVRRGRRAAGGAPRRVAGATCRWRWSSRTRAGTSTRCSRRSATAGAALVHDRSAGRPRAADDPADRAVPVPPPAPRRLRDRRAAAWLARLEPFLADGLDAYVYFRHDEVGPRRGAGAGARGAGGDAGRPCGSDPTWSGPAREPSAGPNATNSVRSSVMSWKWCGHVGRDEDRRSRGRRRGPRRRP